jgi:hypothetical protein
MKQIGDEHGIVECKHWTIPSQDCHKLSILLSATKRNVSHSEAHFTVYLSLPVPGWIVAWSTTSAKGSVPFPPGAQKQENNVQNDRCVRRRVLLDYSADYPHRKRPPGKNYGYSFSNQRSTELRFSKKQKLVFFIKKANAVTITTTNYTDLKTLRNHKPIASSTSFNERKYEQTDSL